MQLVFFTTTLGLGYLKGRKLILSRLFRYRQKYNFRLGRHRIHALGTYLESCFFSDKQDIWERQRTLTKNTTAGHPINARAADSFLLFPPLYEPARLSAYSERAKCSTAHLTTEAVSSDGTPRSRAQNVKCSLPKNIY